jgi:hypothetical protein
VDDFQSPSEKALNNQINLFSLCAPHRLKWYVQSPERMQNQSQGKRSDRRRHGTIGETQGEASIEAGGKAGDKVGKRQ